MWPIHSCTTPSRESEREATTYFPSGDQSGDAYM